MDTRDRQLTELKAVHEQLRARAYEVHLDCPAPGEELVAISATDRINVEVELARTTASGPVTGYTVTIRSYDRSNGLDTEKQVAEVAHGFTDTVIAVVISAVAAVHAAEADPYDSGANR